MGKFLKKCKKEIFLFLSTNLIWAAIGVSLAYILQYITDTALQNITGRILQIVTMAALYLVFDTMFEFASSYTEIICLLYTSPSPRDS